MRLKSGSLTWRNTVALAWRNTGGLTWRNTVQCLQSSLALDGGAIHWQHCITDLLKTFKTLIKMSQELPALFEIVLRPIWWAAGCEQPSPPLHPAAVAGLLRRSQRCCCCSCSASGFLCSKHTIFPNFFANHISDGQRV